MSQSIRGGLKVRGERLFSGPVFSDSLANRTTGSLEMEVDYLLGTSPPVGTVVTSQDDYDELVATFANPYLKYPQDAVDILPPVLAQSVLVNLAAGEHRGKPDSYGPAFGLTSSLLISEKVWDITKNGVISDLYPASIYNGSIQFQGSMQVEDVDQSGVITGNVLARDSGSWTADEHFGRFVEITSGASAGTRYVITGNSITELYATCSFPSNGACTFEVIEPAAKLNGEFQMWLGIGGTYGGLNEIFFNSVDVGTIAAKASVTTMGAARLYLKNSRLLGDRLSIESLVLEDSYAYTSSAVGSAISKSLTLHQSLFGIEGTTFDVISTASVSAYYGVIKAQNGFSGVMLDLQGRCLSSNGPTLDGRGLAAGMLLSISSNMFVTGTLTIDNCTTALELNGGAHVSMSAVSGTGNDTGLKLSEASQLVIHSDPTLLEATNEIDIDGEVLTYAEAVPNAGDVLVGQSGSRFMR